MLTKDKIKVGTKLYCITDSRYYKNVFEGEVIKVGRRWADVQDLSKYGGTYQLDMDTGINGYLWGKGFVAYESEQAYLDYQLKNKMWQHLKSALQYKQLPGNISIADMLDFAEAIGVELPTEYDV